MDVTRFIQEVEVKLNRIDTSAYQDIRPEEVVFFANDALKTLVLTFDLGAYSQLLDKDAIKVYLASLHFSDEKTLTDNKVSLPAEVFKFKGAGAYVEIGEEKGWTDTRWLTNDDNDDREGNPFMRSFPDKPIYRLIDNKIVFETSDFAVTKMRYDYLKYPTEIIEGGTITFPFIMELEDKTVTLILENLEARRLQSQPAVSRS